MTTAKAVPTPKLRLATNKDMLIRGLGRGNGGQHFSPELQRQHRHHAVVGRLPGHATRRSYADLSRRGNHRNESQPGAVVANQVAYGVPKSVQRHRQRHSQSSWCGRPRSPSLISRFQLALTSSQSNTASTFSALATEKPTRRGCPLQCSGKPL